MPALDFETRIDCRWCPICGEPFYRPERFITCPDRACTREGNRQRYNAMKAEQRRQRFQGVERAKNCTGPYAVIRVIQSRWSGNLPVVHGQYRTEAAARVEAERLAKELGTVVRVWLWRTSPKTPHGGGDRIGEDLLATFDGNNLEVAR